MGNQVTISNRDIRVLLERWGFDYEGGNGGHAVMKHRENGKRVQIKSDQASALTPHDALIKASRIVGVSLSALKAGPGRKRGGTPKKVLAERRQLEARVASEWQTPLVVPEPIVEPKAPIAPIGRPSELVYGALKQRPERPCSSAELQRFTGLTRSQVGSALQWLRQTKPDVVAVKPGVHKFAVPEIEVLEAEAFAPEDRSWEQDLESPDPLVRLAAHQAKLDFEKASAARPEKRRIVAGLEIRIEEPTPVGPQTCFNLVGTDRTGRMLLRSDCGGKFLAHRVFSDFDESSFLPCRLS